MNASKKWNYKNCEKTQGDGITLTNNEIKDVTKVMRSFENTGVFL